MGDNKVTIISVNKTDTLVFKFGMELGGAKLTEIANNFSRVVGCGVICLDNKADLTLVIKGDETRCPKN